jgi:hypothetical protein
MNARSILAIVLLCSAWGTALAGGTQVPEPGVLELLGIGAVAAVAVAIRKRRK